MQRRAKWERAIERGAHWSETEARAALATQKKSGESIAAFGRRHGIAPKRLYWWRDRLGGAAAEEERSKRSKEPIGRLIPLTVVQAPAPRGLVGGHRVVVIDGGLRVEVEEPEAVSPAWVATLVRAVRDGA